MNNKAIEMQFHWIFIMVAGALILTFFGTIAQKQYNLSVEKSEYQLINDLETAFSLALKPNYFGLLKISSPVEFKCADESAGCACTYNIGSKELPFYNKFIFSQQKQEGDLKLWSPDFEKPFRAATFMIIASDNTKYYLVHDLDSTELEKLKSRINNQLNIEFIGRGEAENKQYSGEQKTRFIYYQTTPRNLDSSFNDQDVDAVELLSSGGVNFKIYENNQWTNTGYSQYSQDDSSLFAAMFSENQDMYACQMKKIFRRLGEVGEVYKKKTERLSVTNPQCAYDANKIQNLIDNAELSKFSILNTRASTLNDENQRIIRQGCPEIY